MVKARIEMVLAAIFAALAIVTLTWPTWIESLSGLEPDRGSGELEWLITAVFAVVAVGAALLSRRDYRTANRNLAEPTP